MRASQHGDRNNSKARVRAQYPNCMSSRRQDHIACYICARHIGIAIGASAKKERAACATPLPIYRTQLG